MCGITGVIGKQANETLLKSMLSKQQHRGPDYTGTWLADGVALGHNRLSIIDLTPASNQPFINRTGRYTLVFNGEIYNYLEVKKELAYKHSFTTSSDTEVLLAAYEEWGRDCLSKLNGMFSFAIWDNEKEELFAARDRFGVKPFYYSVSNSTLFFASEIPTLFAAGVDKQPNEEVWASFFAYASYGMPDQTFWEGVHQLPAGYTLTWRSSELELNRWYNFEERVKQLQKSSQADEEGYITSLLNDAIKLRFRADVPIGFNLSGGLDSSMLLALVNHAFPNNNEIEAFTFYTDDERYDELKWVEKMLEGKAYPLNKCLLSKEQVVSNAKLVADMQAEPFGGVPTMAYAEVFKSARAKGTIVLLDGQGSDEAWAGYDYYTSNSQSVVQGSSKSSPLRPNVLAANFLLKAKKPAYPKPFDDDLLDKQYRDLFYTKIPRALRFNDRVSMMHSTELREPFLDYRLVEYVFSRPRAFKIQDGHQKWFLRKIATAYLGEELTLAPKRPLQTPQREWLGKDLKPWVKENLSSLNETGWFNEDSLKKEVQDYFDGDHENSFYIWQLLNTALIFS